MTVDIERASLKFIELIEKNDTIVDLFENPDVIKEWDIKSYMDEILLEFHTADG